MKQFIVLIGIICMLFLFAGCSQQSEVDNIKDEIIDCIDDYLSGRITDNEAINFLLSIDFTEDNSGINHLKSNIRTVELLLRAGDDDNLRKWEQRIKGTDYSSQEDNLAWTSTIPGFLKSGDGSLID